MLEQVQSYGLFPNQFVAGAPEYTFIHSRQSYIPIN
jgi:hypothetical protein